MKRCLLVLGLAACAVLFSARPAHAQTTLSIATLAPEGSTWMRVFDAWNRELRRRSNKALQFRFYAGGVQGDESEVIRKIRTHRLDGGAVTAVGLAQIYRPTLTFQMPGLFHNYQELDRARDGLRSDLDTAFQSAGFVLLGWGDVGTDHIFANRAVHTPADLAATKPWVWRDDAIYPQLFAEIGAHATPLQVPEVLTSLQTNTVDSLISSPLATVSLQWSTRLTHMTDYAVAYAVGALVLGKPQFDALPADQQQLLRDTATQYTQLLVRNVRHDDDNSVAPMQSHGLTVDTLSASERTTWDGVLARVRTRLTGTSSSAIADSAFVTRVTNLAQGH